MSEESMMLEAGLSNEQTALQVLERYLGTAAAFRDALIDYDDQDEFSVAVYDALLCLSIRRVQSAISLLGGSIWVTEDELLMSP